MTAQKDTHFITSLDEMESFMERCMLAVGSKPSHAKMLASCLIAADYRGHFSHGLNRLGIHFNNNNWFGIDFNLNLSKDKYVNDVRQGSTSSNEEPIIIKESAATAFVDGNNLLGPVVGK